MDRTFTGSKTVKIVYIISALIILSGAVSSSDLLNPVASGSHSADQPINFSIENKTSFNNLKLRIAPPKSDWREFNLTYKGSEGEFKKTVKGSLFREKGVYRYYFTNGSTVFPANGSLRLSIASTNQSFENTALNITTNISESRDCPYNSSDNSCGYETFQAEMILSNIVAYEKTQNKTFLNRSLKYSVSEYGGSPLGTCDHSANDFDCGNDGTDDEIDASSGERQGALINSLWRVYSITGNSTVRELAENYSQGSAENCDVWNNDFKCNVSGQGAMINGYWTAYKTTGNQTYREIAENLSDTNHSSSGIANSLFKAYQLTGRTSYRDKAGEISINLVENYSDNSSNITERKHLNTVLALWTGYKTTSKYSYYHHASDLTTYNDNFSCNPSGNSYRCSFPDTQGLHSRVYWSGFRYRKDLSKRFANPYFSEVPMSGENASLNAEMQGDMSDPKLYYRMRGDTNWTSCNIDLFNGCRIAAENVSNQTVYSYRFQDGNLTFPENGSFRFSISLGDDELKEEAANFSSTDPEQYCQPWNNDFSCEDAVYQSPMIEGFSTSFPYNSLKSYKERLFKFIRGPFRTQTGSTAACDPADDDFDCNTSSVVENVEGSLRQGQLIDSLFKSYQNTENGTAYETALNFTKGSADDCDVWNNDFDCGSSEGQGAMINGYWTAYKTTGNQTYREIAVNLSSQGLDKNKTQRLGSALWRTYAYTNNTSYRNSASQISERYRTECGLDCEPRNYSLNLALLEKSYVYANDSYLKNYRSILGNTTSSGCGPFKGNYTCATPDYQGMLTSSFYRAFYTLPLKYNTSESLTVSKSSVKTGESFDTTCKVSNRLEDTNISDVKLALDLSSGLSTDDNLTYTGGTLSYNNSTSNTWTVTAVSSGGQSVHCVITSSSGLNKKISKQVNVKEPQKEEDGSGSSSSGGGGISGDFTQEPEKLENITLNYSYSSSYSWNKTRLESIGFNTSQRNLSFDPSCVHVERELKQDISILRISHSCNSTDLLIADPVPENITFEESPRTFFLENFTGSTEILYDSRGPENWSKPVIVFSKNITPELEIERSFINRTEDSGVLNISLNRAKECTVRKSGSEIYSAETSSVLLELNLSEGENSYSITCGDKIESFSVHREPSKDDKARDLALPVLGTLFVIALISGLMVKTDAKRFITSPKLIVYHWYLRRFEKAVNNDDIEGAIKIYASMSSHLGSNTSKRILNSDIDLMRGIRIYLLMDLVESGIENNLDLPVKDIEEIVYRYVETSNNEGIKQMVLDKLDNIAESN